jgi:hypothetical protein
LFSSNTYLPPTVVIPGTLLISNITQANPMVVTIVNSDENSYIVGQLVRLIVPPSYGMFQADQLTGQIIAINGDDFSLNINSTQFDAFVIPGPGVAISRPASLSPAGSKNLQFNNDSTRVPFQNLNNIGN